VCEGERGREIESERERERERAREREREIDRERERERERDRDRERERERVYEHCMTRYHGNTLRITFAYILRYIPKKTSFFFAKADVLPDKITLV